MHILIRESISDYRHIDLGNIKLAFTRVCQEELFSGVYFAANALYYVVSGSAILQSDKGKTMLGKGEAVLIKQHSKLDIRKFKDADGSDFRSVIFYLFPDFVTQFVKQSNASPLDLGFSDTDLVPLGNDESLNTFSQSLVPLLNAGKVDNEIILQKTFEALKLLSSYSPDFLGFLRNNNKPIKIDLYEFMIHVDLYNYSVPDLARLTGRSLSAFKRDFSVVFGTTPHQWLLGRRIDYAEQVMKETKLRASDIYVMLGFDELSNFSAAFKKRKGISPVALAR